MKKDGKIPKSIKRILQGLPIVTVAGATLLPLQRLGQQFIMLFVLLWIQAFFIIECFLIDR
jgi:hypothetical protein